MKLIRLKLKGPLQSWGEQARWDIRDTSNMPAKSAIIGILGCCMGYPRGDRRLATLSEQIHIAVRADRAGRLMTDFHTVQGTDGVMLNAAGKPRGKSGTIITPKQYLQDAEFTVLLWGEEQTLLDCEYALRHPVWPPFLGRRSCVPSVPLLPKILEVQSIEEAICMFDEEEYDTLVSVEIEMLPGEQARSNERIIERRDEVLRADLNQYRCRRVRAFVIRKEGNHVSE